MGAKIYCPDLHRIEFPKRGRRTRYRAATAGQDVVDIGLGTAKPAGNTRNMAIGKVAGHFCGNDCRQDFNGIGSRFFDYRKAAIHRPAVGQKQPNDR